MRDRHLPPKVYFALLEAHDLSGDTAKNCPIRPYGPFYYVANLTRYRVLAVHSDVAEIINELAEQGATLAQAFDRVTLHLAIQRFIEKEIQIHEDSLERDSPRYRTQNAVNLVRL